MFSPLAAFDENMLRTDLSTGMTHPQLLSLKCKEDLRKLLSNLPDNIEVNIEINPLATAASVNARFSYSSPQSTDREDVVNGRCY